MKIDLNDVKNTYSNKKVVESYLMKQEKMGLSKPEKTLIDKYFNEDQRVLDIGCGTGRICFGLSKMGFNSIVGIDLSDEMIKQAKAVKGEQEHITFKVQNILTLEKCEEKYDVITAIHAITPIPGKTHRLEALNQLRSCLNVEGILIIAAFLQESNPSYWTIEESIWAENKQDKRLSDYGDILVNKHGLEVFIHIPERAAFESMIEDAGFRIKHCYDWTELVDDDQQNDVQSAGQCTYWVLTAK